MSPHLTVYSMAAAAERPLLLRQIEHARRVAEAESGTPAGAGCRHAAGRRLGAGIARSRKRLIGLRPAAAARAAAVAGEEVARSPSSGSRPSVARGRRPQEEPIMTATRFERVMNLLTGRAASRRGVLRGLAGGALGAGFGALALEAAACAPNGTACRNGGRCCSGVCASGTCRRAPQQGTCTIERRVCAVGKDAARCGPASSDCACYRRSTGAAFCANFDSVTCAACATDQDCVDLLGPGRVCLRAGGPLCCAAEGTTTACARPCAPASS